MEPLVNLQDLLQHEIEDLYSAEEQIIEALPKMVEKATNAELKAALHEHLKITEEQKKRLDKVRQLLHKESGAPEEQQKKGLLARLFGGSTKCKGTEGLIKEGEKMMGEKMDPKVMDAAIIASAQKVEHYEISGYGTARAYAQELGHTEVTRLLEITLNEEYKADALLTALALNKVNVEADKREKPGAEVSINPEAQIEEASDKKEEQKQPSDDNNEVKKAAPKGVSKSKAAKKGVSKEKPSVKKASSKR